MKIFSLIFFLIISLNIFSQNNGDIIRYKTLSNTSGNIGVSLPSSAAFGSGICNIGDLNNDGVIDLAIGVPGYNNYGAVFIMFMDTNGTAISTKIISQNINGISGLNSAGRFGNVISCLGDINNDGISDIAVTEVNCPDGGTNTGAVHIITLDSLGNVTSQTKISKTTGYGTGGIPIQAGSRFGVGVATIGDLNNDGNNDIIVGSYLDDQTGTDQGAAWILMLDSTHKVQSYKKIVRGITNFNPTFSNNDRFGASVADIGDYNNDGIPDVAIGSPNDQDGVGDAGAFYILYLDTTGGVLSYSKICNSVVSGSNPFMRNFSTDIAIIEDINGDGRKDFSVGAYRLDNDKGGFYHVCLDSNDNVIYYNKLNYIDIPNLTYNIRLGGTVEYLGDYNNDGRIEVAVNASYTGTGSVRILSLYTPLGATLTKQNIQCNGDSSGIATALAYGANPPFTYLWSNGATTNTISNLIAGTYTVTVNNGINTFSSSTTITQAPEIILTTTNDTNICTNTSITLNSNASGGTGNKTIYWSNTTSNNNSQIITPTTSMDYHTWAIDANSCVSDTATISIGFSISSPSSFSGLNMQQCLNDNPIILIGTPSGGTFNGNGITGNIFNPILAGTGIHMVTYTVTDSIGCLSADTMFTLINPLPNTFAGNDTLIPCGSNGAQIGDNTESLHTFLWTPYAGLNNPFISNPIANPWVNTTFIVTKTSLTTQCISTDTVVVNIPSSAPSVNITGDTTICYGDTMHLVANAYANVSFDWTNGSNQSNFDEVILNSKYIVTIVTDENNCKGIDSIYAVVNDLPNPFLGNDTTINKNQSLTLNAGNFQSFIWNTGESTQTITLDSNILTEGNQLFSVFVTDNNTCVGSDTILINFIIGIKELAKNNNISLYPNPANDFINIEYKNTLSINLLSIYDMNGRLVFTKEINTKSNNIRANISTLSKGNYFIILTDNKNTEYGLQLIKN